MAFFLGVLHNCVSMFLFSWVCTSSRFWALCALICVSGCSTLPAPSEPTREQTSAPALSADLSSSAQASWKPMHLPGKRKTQFTHTTHDGRPAVLATANSSVSMFRRQLSIPADDLGALKFSWKVPSLIHAADMGQRELDDSPVRIVLSFEGDRSRFSHKNRMLSELSLALTGEELPYATLMYVWCNQCKAGDVIVNPRTDRIRKMSVESGVGNLGRWLDYERDIRADFINAFGEEPGALTGIALMTDTDNTQSKATAWYGPVSLKAK